MIELKDLIKITDFQWEIPVSYRADMRVPVRLIASKGQLEDALKDRSLEQAMNATTLPGVVEFVVVMPDIHQGYGFPIGGVAATQIPDGAISPGAIGFDINCGVRLLGSDIFLDEVKQNLNALADSVFQLCPSGVGKEGLIEVSKSEMESVCSQGIEWAINKGYAEENDKDSTEHYGSLLNADVSKISNRAMTRGKNQLGSLGSGNHFIEIGTVEAIFDPQAAERMKLAQDHLTVLIHSGSRGLGHQICTDYVHEFQTIMSKNNMNLPDRELVSAPLSSSEGQAYLGAMQAAANYAFVNRQLLTYQVRRAFNSVLSKKIKNTELSLVYDNAHNIGNIETQQIDNAAQQVFIHRKGATRVVGPGSRELPARYQEIGQPAIVPGSMGTGSWVLLGTNNAARMSLSSCCHGAGRLLSRSEAKRSIISKSLLKSLESSGIIIRTASLSGLAEEAPQAYKDVDDVISVITEAGIAQKVARLRPIIVIKG